MTGRFSGDPFAELGLTGEADADAIRRARRELARTAHPDTGGDHATMQRINAAAAEALRRLRDDSAPVAPAPAEHATGPSATRPSERHWGAERTDAPSFTVEALPAETFEALLLAGAALGDIEDDDPPYRLSVRLSRPIACWCDLTVLPDAGASTVSVAIAPDVEVRTLPPIEVVRDAWIAELNQLDWTEL